MPTTTTGQTIIDGCSQDVRHQLSSSADSTLLLDYVDRIHRDIIRDRRHPFLLSEPKYFITEKGVANYGIMTSPPAGCWNTGLSLTDVGAISYVYNRSTGKIMAREDALGIVPSNFQDGTSNFGPPDRYLRHENVPEVLQLAPVPDNAITYQPAPAGPIVTTSAAGALSARTYYVKLTFVDAAGGESVAGPTARVYVPASKVLVVKSPLLHFSASGALMTYPSYNVYISTTETQEVLQATKAFAADYTEPNTGLIAGVVAPGTSTIEPLRGYLIEFRYYMQLTPISATSTVLQIPNDYRDVVIAGTNALAYLYLRNMEEAATWKQIYDDGKRDIAREANNDPREADFIRPGQ